MEQANGPLGIFGGTFDPVHYGHLRLAEEAADALRLDAVRWIPSGVPGHRAAPRTVAAHRIAMLERAIAGNRRFTLDTAEAHASAPGFTIDTLKRLRAELGAERPLIFIIGTDQLLTFDRWRDWRVLFDLAHFAVGERSGYPIRAGALSAALAAEYGQRYANWDALRAAPAGRIAVFPMTALAISASAIRRAAATGASVRYLLPPEVLAYIEAHQLYREGDGTGAMKAGHGHS